MNCRLLIQSVAISMIKFQAFIVNRNNKQMIAIIKTSVCLLLIFGLQPISATNDTDFEEVVRRIDFNSENAIRIARILNKLPSYYQQAVQLWQIFEQLHDVFAATPRFQQIDTDARLNMLNSKIDKLSADVKAFKDRLFKKLDDKFDRKSLEEKMERLVKEMKNINENYYLKFFEYTNSSASHQEFYILQLAEDAVSAAGGLEKSLIQMKTDLLDTTVNYKNILYFLADQRLVNELMCSRQQSAQQSIHVLYEQLLLTEIRAYLMLLFSIQIINEVHNQDRDVNVLEKNFADRAGMIYIEVKKAMTGASREVWRCDNQFVEAQTYDRLRPIFQKYVLHESEAFAGGNSKKRPDLGCHKDCQSITNERHRQCLYDLCTHAYRKACFGILRDCEFKHKSMTVCSSNDSAYRRYEYIRTGDGHVYGVENTCPRNESTGNNRLIMDINFNIYWCDYCMCTCDTSTNPSESVYINLRPVLSDVNNHKVVTGVQIENGEMIHLQIREGELLPSGRINTSTLHYQPIEYYSVQNESYHRDSDYTQISWEKRAICLDDLDSPENDRVLTGLKFELDNNKVQLAIHLTRFDFLTGKLIQNDSKWISHKNLPKAPERSTLSMKYLDIPKGHDVNEPRSHSGQCIEFHTSGLEQDAGQNVVPFIDIQPLITNPPAPLSGAGLFLRGSEDTGGFLTPKIFTFNIEPHTHKPNISQFESI